VIRLVDTDGDGRADSRDILIDDYPTSGAHTTRTVEFLPDGRMVVSVGSSCNVCLEEDPRRAAVLVYDGPQATGERIFASGLRNAVGLAIHPETGELWATNNGRDFMGDDLPPETVYIVRDGVDYGWPGCHSGNIVDPEFGGPDACQDVGQPVTQMQAHSAPLGLTFYDGEAFPDEFQGDLFIAFHGSWNRSVPTGYKVVRLPLQGSQPAGPVEDFAVGWLDNETGEASGRPVGLAVGPDGALFVSDDKGGFIYRITNDR
jgi:glucose/arabinose dehydrogenase